MVYGIPFIDDLVGIPSLNASHVRSNLPSQPLTTFVDTGDAPPPTVPANRCNITDCGFRSVDFVACPAQTTYSTLLPSPSVLFVFFSLS